MTEKQKQQQLANIAEQAAIAEYNGLTATAKHWRDLHATVAALPAEEIVLALSRAIKPANPI